MILLSFPIPVLFSILFTFANSSNNPASALPSTFTPACKEVAKAASNPEGSPQWLPLPKLVQGAELRGEIAKGSTGKVYAVQWKERLWAVKDALPTEEAQADLARDYHFQKMAYPSDTVLVESEGRSFIRMPHYPMSLESFMRRGYDGFDPFSSDPAKRDKKFIGRLGQALLKELKRLHDLGIVHGDVKPNNILISLGLNHEISVRFIDFCYATKKGDPMSILHADGMVFGTPAYSSREMWQGHRVTPERDLRALQKALLHLYTRDVYETVQIERQLLHLKWKEPAQAFDHFPELVTPTTAFVLASHLPKNVVEFDAMLKQSFEPNFIDKYAEQWQNAFQKSDILDRSERDELLIELVQSNAFGVPITKKLDPKVRARVIELIKAQEAGWKESSEQGNWVMGWHDRMKAPIREYLRQLE